MSLLIWMVMATMIVAQGCTIFLKSLKYSMIDIEIQISISERSSGWAINYPHIELFPKKNPGRVIPTKSIFWRKNGSKGLSSGQINLQPIWGHGHQLDDRHRNPNINIREIIWLGNQLGAS